MAYSAVKISKEFNAENKILIPLSQMTGDERQISSNLVRWPFDRYFDCMSIAAEKVAEVLALPEQDRAFLARELIASLDDAIDGEAEAEWNEIIDRRSREIAESKVSCRPVEQVIQDIRNKLHARRQPS
jgi:putative addiction module component (TIGR02574 family)